VANQPGSDGGADSWFATRRIRIVRESVGSIPLQEARFRTKRKGSEGAFSRWGASLDIGGIAGRRFFELNRPVLCVTILRIRRSPQARLVRGTSRAIVNADQFNVMRTPKRLRPDADHKGGVIERLDNERTRSPASDPARRAELGECGVSSTWAIRGDIVRGVG
jgi:hypothetical protein